MESKINLRISEHTKSTLEEFAKEEEELNKKREFWIS